jgi:RNA polymerase sigma factor for flagellar operon FliA
MLNDHFGLVRTIAARVGQKLPPCVEMDDLVGAGTLGLIDAVDRFDPSRGVQFRTYAERRIRGAMMDHLRTLDWAPRSLRRRARDVEAAQFEVETQLGRPASQDEIAEHLGLDLKDLLALLAEIRSAQVASLSSAVDGEATEPEVPLTSHEPDPFECCLRRQYVDRLAAAIEQLTPRERLVMSLYYVEELTMKEIGVILGVNESRVSQIHSRTIGRLRALMD